MFVYQMEILTPGANFSVHVLEVLHSWGGILDVDWMAPNKLAVKSELDLTVSLIALLQYQNVKWLLDDFTSLDMKSYEGDPYLQTVPHHVVAFEDNKSWWRRALRSVLGALPWFKEV